MPSNALFGLSQNSLLCGFGGRFCSSSNKLMLPYCQTSSRASFFSQSAQGGPQVTCLRLGKFSHPALHTHYCFLRSCSLEMVPKVKHATTIIWYTVTQTIFEILLPKYLPTVFILWCYYYWNFLSNMEIMYEIEKTVKRQTSFFTAEKFLIFSPFPVRRSSRSVGSNLSSFWAGRVSCWPARCFRCFAKESEGWMARPQNARKYLLKNCCLVRIYRQSSGRSTPKPWYSEQVDQTLFVHYIE